MVIETEALAHGRGSRGCIGRPKGKLRETGILGGRNKLRRGLEDNVVTGFKNVAQRRAHRAEDTRPGPDSQIAMDLKGGNSCKKPAVDAAKLRTESHRVCYGFAPGSRQPGAEGRTT